MKECKKAFEMLRDGKIPIQGGYLLMHTSVIAYTACQAA